MHNSSRWRCDKRRILNCRRMLPPLATDSRPHPCLAVENALKMSFAATATLTEGQEATEALVPFLDATCLLRHCSLAQCSEAEQMAYFINLYHLMTQHAYLVLGPPASAQQWLGMYNLVAYQTADDIFSLGTPTPTPAGQLQYSCPRAHVWSRAVATRGIEQQCHNSPSLLLASAQPSSSTASYAPE